VSARFFVAHSTLCSQWFNSNFLCHIHSILMNIWVNLDSQILPISRGTVAHNTIPRQSAYFRQSQGKVAPQKNYRRLDQSQLKRFTKISAKIWTPGSEKKCHARTMENARTVERL
jgi:hypothetical protein